MTSLLRLSQDRGAGSADAKNAPDRPRFCAARPLGQSPLFAFTAIPFEHFHTLYLVAAHSTIA